ncbi:MAG TPA: N-acetylmuramic acid 6-phosphate etherase [Gaiellaceae bacterium]|nr:N-acetylmuramic acid 6-phosphate etherase [Gaiellaceae bacterium]
MTLEARVDDPVTERRIEANADLDLLGTLELVELVNDADATVAAAVRAAAAPLAEAVDGIVERLERGGRLVYVGAGTSGRLAAVDAAECPSTFGVDPERVLAVVALEEGHEDDARAGKAALGAARIGADDAVVALSASGRTPWVLGAVESALAAGALTVGVACAPDSPLVAMVDHPVTVVVGPEVIAGSTRMKAGTAQKLVLNTISTIAMVRLGKTFGNLMVAVAALNEKQRSRARRTVELATGAGETDVDAALDAADGDARVAIVSLLAGVDAADARSRLERNRGVVRRSLKGP